MSVDKARLARIAVGSGTRYCLGSGYLVAPDLIITARHVVGEEPESLGREALVGFTRETQDWQSASVVWATRGDAGDVALLRLKAPRSVSGEIAWGQCEQYRAKWLGGGFPAAGEIEQPDGNTLRESVGVGGTVEPLGGAFTERYELSVDGPPPESELWQGLSGGPVFVDEHLVGVIEAARGQFGGVRLWATSVAVLFADPRWQELLNRPSLRRLRVPEPRPISLATDQYLVETGIHGAKATRLRAPLGIGVEPTSRPVSHRPRPFVALCDRTEELAGVREALAVRGLVVVSGRAGAGKTALLRVISNDDLAAFHDGVVYVVASGKSPVDLRRDIHDRFFTSPVEVAVSEALFAERFRSVNACIVLDDFGFMLDELYRLVNMAPSCAWIAATESAHPVGVDAKAVALSGLPDRDALALMQQLLERRLEASEEAAGQRLIERAAGHPGMLVYWAARARSEKLSLPELEKVLPRDERTPWTWASWLRSLSPRELRVIAALGIFGGIVLRASDVFALTGDALAEDALERLAQGGLVQSTGTAYRLAPGAPVDQSPELASRFLEHALGAARRRAAEPEALLELADRIGPAVAMALKTPHAGLALEAAKTLEPALLRGALLQRARWPAWKQLLDATRVASVAMGDRISEGWAVHQLGISELCSGNMTAAKQLLEKAAVLRQAAGDPEAAQFSRAQFAMIPKTLAPLAAAIGVLAVTGVAVGIGLAVAYITSAMSGVDGAAGAAGGGDSGSTTSAGGAPGTGGTGGTVDAAENANVGGKAGAAGTGPILRARPVFEPSELAWGALPAGTNVLVSRQTKQVTLTNSGRARLEQPTLVFVPTKGHDFRLTTNDCHVPELNAGAACALKFDFQPRKVGAQTARVELKGYSSAAVNLSGEGVSPSLTLAASSLHFTGYTGDATLVRNLDVVNAGPGPIKIVAAYTSNTVGDSKNRFAVDPSRCVRLDSNARCKMDVSFMPRVKGESEGLLIVKTSTEQRTVTLTAIVHVIE